MAGMEANRPQRPWITKVVRRRADFRSAPRRSANRSLRAVAIDGDPLECVGRTLDEVLSRLALESELARHLLGGCEVALEQLAPVRLRKVIPTPAGTLTTEATVSPIVGDDGRCRYLLFFGRDITDRANALRLLNERRRRGQRQGPMGAPRPSSRCYGRADPVPPPTRCLHERIGAVRVLAADAPLPVAARQAQPQQRSQTSQGS